MHPVQLSKQDGLVFMQITQSETPNCVFLGVHSDIHRDKEERLHSKMTRPVSPPKGTRAEGRRRREGWATTVSLRYCKTRQGGDTLIGVGVPHLPWSPEAHDSQSYGKGGVREPSLSSPQTWGFPAGRLPKESCRAPKKSQMAPGPCFHVQAREKQQVLGVKEQLSPRQFCLPLQARGNAFCWMPGTSTWLRALDFPVLSTRLLLLCALPEPIAPRPLASGTRGSAWLPGRPGKSAGGELRGHILREPRRVRQDQA